MSLVEEFQKDFEEMKSNEQELLKSAQEREDLMGDCRRILARSFQYTQSDAKQIVERIFSEDPPNNVQEFIDRVFRGRE